MPTRLLSRPMLAIAAFVLGSILTMALAGGAYYAYRHATRGGPPPPRPTIFTRPEFSKRVMGKSEDEVIQTVGRPDETTEDRDTRFWHFKNRTRDPLTGEEDTDVQVVLKGGKVAEINY